MTENKINGEKQELRKRASELLKKRRRKSPKFIRDPIHDIIKIDDDIILQALDSAPMQRLRKIKQLGVAHFVFPGAEHSRFTHSLGVYHLSKRMLEQLKLSFNNDEILYYDEVIIQLAALLHDIGHGPFSHLFENVLKDTNYLSEKNRKHETWTLKLIEEEGSLQKVFKFLDDENEQFAQLLKNDVKSVIATPYYKPYLHSIVSSQFDADRFDYMLRDSMMTGVKYGEVDINWILRNLTVLKEKDEKPPEKAREDFELWKVVLNIQRGKSSLEEYLLGNLNLYENVYWHKTVLAAGTLIKSILMKALNVLLGGNALGVDAELLERILKNEPFEIEEYLASDDFKILNWIDYWAVNHSDAVLSDLSKRFKERRFFKAFMLKDIIDERDRDKVRVGANKFAKKKGLDPDFYVIDELVKRKAYERIKSEEIYFIQSDDDIEPKKYSDISHENNTVSMVIQSLAKHEKRILFVPEDIFSETKKLYDSFKKEES